MPEPTTQSDAADHDALQTALRRSEERYRTLFESADDGIFLMRGRQFVDCNEGAARLLGSRREQIMKSSPLDYSPEMQPDGRTSKTAAQAHIQAALAGEPQAFEWVHLRADNSPFTASVKLNRLKLHGSFHLMAVVRDIESEKAGERALETANRELQDSNRNLLASQKQLRASNDELKVARKRESLLVESLPLALYIARAEGEYGGLWVSHQIKEISGFTAQAFVDNKELWAERLHPDDRERVLADFEAIGKEGGSLRTEYRWKAANDEYRWLQDCSAVIERKMGDPYLVGTWLDVTDHHAALDALRQSETNYRAIFNGTTEAIFIHDPETGRTLDVNERTLEMYGRTRAEALGSDIVELSSPDMQFTQDRALELIRLAATGEPQLFEWHAQHSNGSSFWVDVVLKRIDLGGQVRVLAVCRDISQRKHAEKEVALAREEAERHREQLIQADKLASLGTLVAGVAHEINNPNMFITLNAPNLADLWNEVLPALQDHCEATGSQTIGTTSLDELREAIPKTLDSILDGSSRITGIVDSLKDFSRQEDGAMDNAVDLNNVVKRSIALAWNRIKNATNAFSITYSDDHPSVLGSRQRLEQVVVNLLVNACDALESRDQPIDVATSVSPDGTGMHITVQDGGAGMDDATLKQVADPFFTTKRNAGGTGLGVSISRQIVEAHGGSLDFTSTPGQGTVAVVSLPVAHEEPPHA